MHRIIRARYHRAIRHIEEGAAKIQSDKISQAILSEGSRGMWPETSRNKGKKKKNGIQYGLDGCNDNNDITMFSRIV